MFNNANTPGMILEQLGHDHPSLEGPTKLQTELCLGYKPSFQWMTRTTDRLRSVSPSHLPAHLICTFLLPFLFRMLPIRGAQRVWRQSTGHHRVEQREHTRENTAVGRRQLSW